MVVCSDSIYYILSFIGLGLFWISKENKYSTRFERFHKLIKTPDWWTGRSNHVQQNKFTYGKIFAEILVIKFWKSIPWKNDKWAVYIWNQPKCCKWKNVKLLNMFLTVKIIVNNASQHAILGKLNTIEVME